MNKRFPTPFKFPFMQWRRGAWFLSGAMLAVTVLALVLFGLNLSIDFTGGAMWSFSFEAPVQEQQIARVFAAQGIDEAVIQQVDEEGRDYQVRSSPVGEEARQAITEQLRQDIGAYTLVSFGDVSPAIGREIQRNALLALILATIGMLIYITIRFEYRFAVAAIITLFHNVFIVVGLFALLRFPVDTSFVAAILTVFGYSLNDTIVIFDRIRENRAHYKRDELEALVNDSLNQTLMRSINTSVTTALALLALTVLGGDTIRPFSIAMLTGVVVGTYASIMVASGIWYEWVLRDARHRAQGEAVTRVDAADETAVQPE